MKKFLKISLILSCFRAPSFAMEMDEDTPSTQTVANNAQLAEARLSSKGFGQEHLKNWSLLERGGKISQSQFSFPATVTSVEMKGDKQILMINPPQKEKFPLIISSKFNKGDHFFLYQPMGIGTYAFLAFRISGDLQDITESSPEFHQYIIQDITESDEFIVQGIGSKDRTMIFPEMPSLSMQSGDSVVMYDMPKKDERGGVNDYPFSFLILAPLPDVTQRVILNASHQPSVSTVEEEREEKGKEGIFKKFTNLLPKKKK